MTEKRKTKTESGPKPVAIDGHCLH